MIKKIGITIYIFVAIFSLLAFSSASISPAFFWPAGLFTFLIPIAILMNILLAIISLLKRSFWMLLPILMIVIGSKFINNTFGRILRSEKKIYNTFSILSYNVRVFNSYQHLSNANRQSSKDIYNFIFETNADIVCLQEFYSDANSSFYNTISKFKKNGYPYYFISNELTNMYGAQFGSATFSKYRIKKSGKIKFNNKTKNQATYIELLINGKKLRVYNIHLQSMSIDEDQLVTNKWDEKSKKNLLTVANQLRKGMMDRASQSKTILKHIENYGKSVIICGDFNDTPYSYTYQQFRKKLQNSFEKEGGYFGFTYNGKLPFLRIDNQFASNDIKIINFNTEDQIKASDHFPLLGKYILP